MSSEEVLRTCDGCGASIYEQHIKNGIAKKLDGKLLCAHCVEELKDAHGGADAGLEDEFRYHGTLDREDKVAFLQGLDVLSVPSPYAEPKGLYLLEALACGVACVQPRHGAFPEVLERTDGGVLFTPGDTDELARQLRTLASDRSGTHALGRRGAEGVRRHHSIARVADRALEVYGSIVAGHAEATSGGN